MWHLIKYAIIAFLLTACATNNTKDVFKTTSVGIPYILHLNYRDAPCPYIAVDAACVTWDSSNIAHVWMHEFAPEYVLKHEEGHVNGMVHTGWLRDTPYSMPCATVIVEDIEGKYELGTTLCVSRSGEIQIKKAD